MLEVDARRRRNGLRPSRSPAARRTRHRGRPETDAYRRGLRLGLRLGDRDRGYLVFGRGRLGALFLTRLLPLPQLVSPQRPAPPRHRRAGRDQVGDTPVLHKLAAFHSRFALDGGASPSQRRHRVAVLPPADVYPRGVASTRQVRVGSPLPQFSDLGDLDPPRLLVIEDPQLPPEHAVDQLARRHDDVTVLVASVGPLVRTVYGPGRVRAVALRQERRELRGQGRALTLLQLAGQRHLHVPHQRRVPPLLRRLDGRRQRRHVAERARAGHPAVDDVAVLRATRVQVLDAGARIYQVDAHSVRDASSRAVAL